MLVRDVPIGMVFKYPTAGGNGLLDQSQFIKLNRAGVYNVVNVANWIPATVDDDTEVVVLGDLKLVTIVRATKP